MFLIDSHFTFSTFAAAAQWAMFLSLLGMTLILNLIPLFPWVPSAMRFIRLLGWGVSWTIAAFSAYLAWASCSKWSYLKTEGIAESTVVYFRHHGSTIAEAVRLHLSFIAGQESLRASLAQTQYSHILSCGFFLVLPLIGQGFSRLQAPFTHFIERLSEQTADKRRRFLLSVGLPCWTCAVVLAIVTWRFYDEWQAEPDFYLAKLDKIELLLLSAAWLFFIPFLLSSSVRIANLHRAQAAGQVIKAA